jgi:hypothetical protein
MSAPTAAAVPATPPPQSAPAAPATVPSSRLLARLLWLSGLVVLAGLAIFLAYPWWSYRQTHSITEDAFVEAHIINVAPQTVSGHIVRFLVEENDRVKHTSLQSGGKLPVAPSALAPAGAGLTAEWQQC